MQMEPSLPAAAPARQPPVSSPVNATQAVVQFNGVSNGHALSPEEREHFLAIVESSLNVRRMSQFFLWAQGPVHRLLPHEILVFGAASGSGASVSFQKLSSTHYFGDAQFNDIVKPGHGLVVRMMSAWNRFGTPLLLARALRTWDCAEEWLADAEKNEMKNVAAHGMRSAAGRVTTYFSFSRVGCEFGSRLYHLLSLLLPYLHETLTRVMIEERRVYARVVRTECSVTDREAEILRWIRDGKTNHDIARILEVSPFTVKNHIQKILRKMGVENRSHAVARAISLGILGSAEA